MPGHNRVDVSLLQEVGRIPPCASSIYGQAQKPTHLHTPFHEYPAFSAVQYFYDVKQVRHSTNSEQPRPAQACTERCSLPRQPLTIHFLRIPTLLLLVHIRYCVDRYSRADERDGTEGGEYNVGNGGDQEYDSGFYYDVPVGLEDGNNDQPQLDDGRDVDTYENDYDHLTEHGGSNDGQHQNIDDRGGGEGNDDEEEGDGDGDGDILRSSAELVDALVSEGDDVA